VLKRLASAASCAGLLLMISACDDSTTGPSGGSSAYAGMWRFTTQLTAVGNACGNSESEIGVPIGPISVEVSSNGRFHVSDPDVTGQIDSSGNVVVTLAATGACPAGSGAGGCRNTSHCNGTAVQGGDVTLWTLARQ
jgi:hypothetical protein